MTLENLIVGSSTMAEWFGQDLRGVPPVVAEHRASVCAACPMNRQERWMDRWPGYAAKLLGIRNLMRERGMVTSFDDRLHVCAVCDCPMKIKVFTPLDIIKNHLPSATMERLHPQCWIKSE